MSRPQKQRTSEPHTDLGNARRFVAQHKKTIRYCSKLGKWLVWDGTRWAIDDTGAVNRSAKDTVRTMYRQASGVIDSGEREAFVRHALISENASRIDALIRLAETEDGIPVRPSELDQDPFSLNCQNGTINLRTGKLRQHQPSDLITKLAPINFDARAGCPVFESFVDRIMGSDKTLVQYLQRSIGYALTGDSSEQVMFVLFGSGANGKTTLLETVRYILGEYSGQLPVKTLMIKRGDSVSNDIAQLKGLRFVTASEVEAGQRLAEAQVKQLTGGGTLQARYLYQEHFQFEPTFKIFMDCNHKPAISGTDAAIWRRIKMIPFNVSIPESERDGHLLQKLKAEAPGILAWAVRGCLQWQRDGLQEPASVLLATSEYREEMDIVAQFVEEECTLRAEARETSDSLYSAFKRWCENRQEQPISKKSFGARLSEMPEVGDAKSGGVRFRTGIAIKRDTEMAA